MSRARRASIVIGNYNYAPYLPQSIDSALSQTYPDVEVVVVDDGSTDNSRAIVESYAGRVRPLFKANGGMGSTYNAGMRLARGDVIVFLDSDDTLACTAVEKAMRSFDGESVAKVHWPLWEVDAQGRRLGGIVPRQTLPQGDFAACTIRVGPDSYLSPPTSGNAWSRRFLERVLPIPEATFRRHADSYLTTLAPLFGPIRKIDEPLASYRIHGHNDFASGSTEERNASNLRIFEQRCQVLAEWIQRLGIEADTRGWKGPDTAYSWMQELSAASETIKSVVPPGETFILVDEAQWADRWGGSDLISDRRSLPFIERDGQYWGPPADDSTAIRELERLRQAGAAFIVFGSPARWWSECYAGFFRYLLTQYRRVHHTDLLMIFDLRRSTSASVR